MAELAVLLGLAGLFFGGDWLVRGASALALRFGISPLVIGLTVVGFGTSMPELLVSVEAALIGAGDIAAGNIVGSNTANILLILGVSALVAPLAAPFRQVRTDLAWMLAVALACLPALADGAVGRGEGLALLAALGLYLVLALRRGSADPLDSAVTLPPLWRAAGVGLAGLATLMAGARLLVYGATEMARDFGISEAVIGLTIVAIGTSLPELATSVAAAWKGERDIALGNVIGSNVFNVLGILGTTAVIVPIAVAPRFLAFDVPLMIAVSVGLAAVVWLDGQIRRATAGVFVLAYGGYIAAMAAGIGG